MSKQSSRVLTEYKREVVRARRKLKRLASNGIVPKEIQQLTGMPSGLSTVEYRKATKTLRIFNDRRQKYIKLGRGGYVSGEVWAKYVNEVKAYNKESARIKSLYGNIDTPSGMTLSERETHLFPDAKYINRNVNSVISNRFANPQKFTGESAVKLATTILKANNAVARDRASNRATMKQLRGLVEVTGDDALYRAFSRLTAKQKFVVWNATDFVSKLAISYGLMQLSVSRGRDINPELHQQNLQIGMAYIKWARKTIK